MIHQLFSNPIKMHSILMAFAFNEQMNNPRARCSYFSSQDAVFCYLILFGSVLHSSIFVWNVRCAHNVTATINFKCTLFSRHYLCSHSLECTHNLHFTDHKKQMKQARFGGKIIRSLARSLDSEFSKQQIEVD